MDADEIKTVYGIMCATWRHEPLEAELMAWALAFEDAEAETVMLAVKQVIREDRPFMPRPGEVLAVARQHDETIPPSVDEATGYYLAGDWSVHPLVEQAAKTVQWDRNHPEVATQAKFDFRQNYEAAVRDHEAGVRRAERQALHGSGEFIKGLEGPDDGLAGAMVPR